MNDNHLSQEFLGYYESTFKPVATKCIKGYRAMVKVENGAKPEDLGEEWDKVKNAVDANAIWYIGLLLGDIEKCRIKGKRLNLINSMSAVHGCLNSDSYWENVWKNDYSSEEAKNLRELAPIVTELMQKM